MCHTLPVAINLEENEFNPNLPGGVGIHPPEDLFTRHFQKKGLIALSFADFS